MTKSTDVTLEKIIKDHILKVLKKNKDNRTHTAKALGIGVRTLHRYLKLWGLNREPYGSDW